MPEEFVTRLAHLDELSQCLLSRANTSQGRTGRDRVEHRFWIQEERASLSHHDTAIAKNVDQHAFTSRSRSRRTGPTLNQQAFQSRRTAPEQTNTGECTWQSCRP